MYFVIAGTLVATHSATTATWSDTKNLPVRIDNINAGSTTNSTISVWVATITRLGKEQTGSTCKHITGVNSSQILKYNAGTLKTIVVGTPVNNATITVYDNTSGTSNVMTVITLPNSAVPIALDYGCPFFTGLNVVPSSTSLDLTIIYE